MSLLFNVIYAHRCTSTHHKMAMDALTLLDGADAAWTEVFLKYADSYLLGAKAPDTVFKDSTNQVLHVHQNYWGGAPKLAREWAEAFVANLKAKKWKDAVYCAGVLSHYYTDPVQPLHTGQCEAEGPVHAPLERSICKSYPQLKQRLFDEHGGYPDSETPAGADWASQMVRKGAETASAYYDLCIDHYDVAAGAKDPLAGMDVALQDVITQLIGLATAGVAAILRRGFEEAGVEAPAVSNDLRAYLAHLDIPIRSLVKKMADGADRKQVEAIAAEFAATGKVVNALSEDDRTIREAHAREVLGVEPDTLRDERARRPGALFGMAASRIVVEKTPLPFDKLGIAKPKPAEETVDWEPERTPQAEPAPKVAAAKPEPAPAPRVEAAKPAPAAPAMTPARNATIVDNPLEAAAPEPALATPAAKPQSFFSRAMAPKAAPVPQPEPAPVAPPAAEARAPSADGETLELDTDVVDAPAIGPKTADRLAAIGVRTVGDLMDLEPDEAAGMLNAPHIKANTIRDWQSMTALAMAVPALRGIDAQALVSIGVRDPETLGAANANALRDKLLSWIRTGDGQRVYRSAKAPSAETIMSWTSAGRKVAA
jgi:hypothetical protein